MMRRSSLLLFAGLLASPMALAGDPLSYSYWEAGYLNVSEDPDVGTGDDEEGFRLAASVGLSKHINFFGDYDHLRPTGARVIIGSAGFGMHTAGPTYQFFGNATYEREEVDDNSASPAIDDDVEEGWGVEVGARMPFDHFELQAAYKYVDLGENTVGGTTFETTKARYGITAALQISPQWSLAAQYRVVDRTTESNTGSSDDATNDYTVSFRRYFATEADRRRRKGGILFGADEEATPAQ